MLFDATADTPIVISVAARERAVGDVAHHRGDAQVVLVDVLVSLVASSGN
jgi:hypothetical protein